MDNQLIKIIRIISFQSEQPTNTSITSSSTEARGWSGAQIQYQFYQSPEMKDAVLLENGYTDNCYCHPKLVENIRTSNKTCTILTNGGDLFTNQCATVPGFGEVWYDPSALTNIFSLELLEKKHCIAYDSTIMSAFIVHLPEKEV
jgi:hypothetical protein